MIKFTRHFLPLLIVMAAAFLSFEHNAFGVASDKWFTGFPGGSEQLVLDGLLHGAEDPGRLRLGTYSRPDSASQNLHPYELYTQKDRGGTFEPYKSQYGLQLRFLYALAALGLDDINSLQSVVAFLMSACVGALFCLVRREFSTAAATIFAASLIFSPWVVVFARTLYWAEATWFLPLIVAMFFAEGALRSRALNVVALSCLFLALLVRFLCGYEYLTTIFLASCVPFVYQATKNGHGLKRITMQIALCGLIGLAAFAVAVGVHSQSLSADGTSGLDVIILTAQKRLTSETPEQVAEAVCRGDEDCERGLVNSLSTNPLDVAASYFMSPDFLPFVRDLEIPQAERDALRAAYRHPGMDTLKNALREMTIKGVYFSVAMLIGGKALLGLLAVTLLLLPKMAPEIRVLVATSLLAPLSWFVIGKGHSAVHHHLNYVLWWLPFIPFSLVALVSVLPIPKKTREPAA